MDYKKLIKSFTKSKEDKIFEYYGEAKPLKKSLKDNLKIIKETFVDTSDVIYREFTIGEEQKIKALIVVIDGLTKGDYVHDYILRTLLIDLRNVKLDTNENDMIKILQESSISMVDISEITDFKALFEALLSGDTIILIDGYNKVIKIETKGWQDRGVVEPSSQTVVRGSKDGFNETLRTNTMLIRRRIKDINLKIVSKSIGEVTKTNIAILYIKGIANDKVVEEVKRRIDKINIDKILDSGDVQNLITDSKNTLFPTINHVERPDNTCADLIEGKVAIIIDTSPYVLTVPSIFVQFFHSFEDYYHHPAFSTFMRFIRFSSFFIALLTPSVYIAITTFHQEMLPTALLISIASQREGIPFPAIVEALIMEFTFEILREAGIRMPRAIGSAISIVGALVLGEAAVQAGIVSAVMVIVVSLTAITSLIIPAYDMGVAVRVLRFIFMLLSATLGLFGIAIGLLYLTLHLCSLRSFGIPYMFPFAPFNLKGQRDALILFKPQKRKQRPNLMSGYDRIREANKK